MDNNKESQKPIAAQKTVKQGTHIYLPLFTADSTKKIQAVWELQLENGERDSGRVKRNRLNFTSLPNGKHQLTIIIGSPTIGSRTKIYHCTILVTE